MHVSLFVYSYESIFQTGIKGSSIQTWPVIPSPLSIQDVLVNANSINCGGVCGLARIVLLCLMIDKDKRDKDDCGTNPVDEAGILLVLEYLADE